MPPRQMSSFISLTFFVRFRSGGTICCFPFLRLFHTLTGPDPDALVAAHAEAAARLGALRATGLPAPAGHPALQPKVPQRAGHLAGGVEGGGRGGAGTPFNRSSIRA